VQISLLLFFLSFTSLYSRFCSKSLSHLIHTKVPPNEKKVVKEREKKWKTYWRTIKTICEKAKRIFKASESILLWFVILKFTYKLKLSLSMKLSLSCRALPWSAPGRDLLSDRGVADATTLARLVVKHST